MQNPLSSKVLGLDNKASSAIMFKWLSLLLISGLLTAEQNKNASENDFYSYPYMHICRVIKEISSKFQNQRPKRPTPVVKRTKPIF